MPDVTAVFDDEGPISLTVGATAVVGGQVVEVSADMTVIPAQANSIKVAGVAMQDGAIGALVAIDPRPGVVHRLLANGAIAAGAHLAVGAVAGSVKTIGAGTFDQKCGLALEAGVDTFTFRAVFLP